MRGTLSLTGAELRRLSRNRRYSIFTIALPVVLYLVIAPSVKHVSAYGVAYAAYYMLAMASIGAFSGALTGNAQRIAQERKDGWVRQLRLTSLPANAYVTAKLIASMATTVPSIVIVLALGRFYGGVHLAGWKWLAVGLVIWIGSLAFASLGVGLGYRFMPDTVQPIAALVYFVMSIGGGLFFALPASLAKIGQVLPTYQTTRIGTDLIGNHAVPAMAYITVLAWFAGFIVLAVWAVRGTAETV